jgi:formate dehydrogenase maturation protein FdhE
VEDGAQKGNGGHASTPALWAVEIVSVLTTAERRGRMNAAAQNTFLERLRLLPIAIEHRPATRDRGSLITANWNQIVEGLERLETLREHVQTSPECGSRPFNR